MGTIKQGILGGFSGSVAGVVGSSWKGIAVIKAKPLSVANPQTAAQTANRTAFKAATLDGSALLVEIVKPLWDRDAQRQSGYNAFVSANKQAYSDAGVLDVTKLVFTLGKLPETSIDSVTFVAGTTELTVGWVNDAGEGEKLGTDIPYVTAFNDVSGEWATKSTSGDRTDEQANVVFDTALVAGDKVSFWLAFQGVSARKIKFKAGSDLSNTVQ